MNRLKEIMEKCKGSVTLSINEHRDCYETIPDFIHDDFLEDIPKDILAEMIERDTCLELRWYPWTPIGFRIRHHYDLDQLLDEVLESVRESCTDE